MACELIATPSVIFADEPTTGMQPFKVYFSVFCRTWRMGRSQTIIQDRMGLLQVCKFIIMESLSGNGDYSKNDSSSNRQKVRVDDKSCVI